MSTTISAIEFCKRMASNRSLRVIDVRTPAEYREVHLPIARNEPLERFDPTAIQLAYGTTPSEPIYVVCRSGSRGAQACAKLDAAGVQHAVNVEGGTLACIDAGADVVRGKKAISLERQVRIVAGSLTLIGAILGYFVHPLAIGLSAFIGAGLLFAGLTDTCGMGMLLAKMPWNQVRTDS
jgi:rhodanese-related sulfurtransferase